MPAEGIAQVHCFAPQAEAKRTLTFTNTNDEDLDVLYVALDQNEDDVDLNHDNDYLAGVDGENNEDANNDDCNPEQDGDMD